MDKYGLIGFPLGHSFSISYHNQRFADEGINAKYLNFEIPSIEELPQVLSQNPELKGLNVTIPYKEKVLEFLDYISPEARAIGAVNVIRVVHEGKKTMLRGYNSDVILLDRLQTLFVPVFCLDVGSLLRTLGQKYVLVAAWPGYVKDNTLCYDKFDGTESIRIPVDGFTIWNVE